MADKVNYVIALPIASVLRRPAGAHSAYAPKRPGQNSPWREMRAANPGNTRAMFSSACRAWPQAIGNSHPAAPLPETRLPPSPGTYGSPGAYGEAQAGDRSAIIYTVIESCRRRGIDPYAYLKDVLTRLPRMTMQQVPQILPAAWGKQPQSLPKAS